MDIGAMIIQFKELFTNFMKSFPNQSTDYVHYRFLEKPDETYISFNYIDPFHNYPYIFTVILKKKDHKQQGGMFESPFSDPFEYVIDCYLNPFLLKLLVDKIKENKHTQGRRKEMQSLVALATQESGKNVLVQKDELPTVLIEEVQMLNFFYIIKPYLTQCTLFRAVTS